MKGMALFLVAAIPAVAFPSGTVVLKAPARAVTTHVVTVTTAAPRASDAAPLPADASRHGGIAFGAPPSAVMQPLAKPFFGVRPPAAAPYFGEPIPAGPATEPTSVQIPLHRQKEQR